MAIGDGVSALPRLIVTFGGFSPTAMDGVQASKEYVERMETIQAERKAVSKRLRDLELARTSKPRTETIGNTTWTYVVVDSQLVRIVHCESTEALLSIPETIEGLPVYAIGPDACSRNDYVEEIICPDTIESIGSCAFRFCPNLRRVTFPEQLITYSPSWLSHCESLEEVKLPGGLDKIDGSILDNAGIKKLYIGREVSKIEPGAFQKTRIEELTIDEANPYITTDGTAIYDSDKTLLIAIARPVSRYEIADTCQYVGKKAACNLESLEEIVFPQGLCVIGEFAFAHTGLREIVLPDSVTELSQKAFYYCKGLRSAQLNDGLRTIGDSVFEESALEALAIPESIEHIGNSITVKSNIVHSGPHCTLTIEQGSTPLFLDGSGGLYRNEDDGVHMIQLIDREIEHYEAFESTRIVDDYAFAYHDAIREVVLPDGVVKVGRSAFRCASRLQSVQLPDSIAEIGVEAFIDTELESFRVPRDLMTLGANALVTRGAHHGDEVPSLRHIEVAPGNEKFFVECGMLCQHDKGIDRIVMFTSSEPRVVFPSNVVSVEAYAFNNARGIEYISLNDKLNAIGTAGLTTWCWIEHIHVELAEPLQGRTSFDFRFPNTRKGIHGISMGLGGASWVNVEGMYAQYDNCVANAHDYNNPRNTDSISIYDQVRMILDRLNDPFLLTKVNRSMYDRMLRNYIDEICVDVARHDDREVMESLIEFGYVNDGNLERIIERVGRLQDAAMTGYLLEVKRRRFNKAVFDFDL